MDQALLERCKSLYNRARLGDVSAHAQISRLKVAAKSGNHEAAVVFNTMAVLHWQAQQGAGRPKWPKAEMFYRRLAANDMVAWSVMTRIQAKAKARDEQAMRVFAMLKAIHKQYQASVWYPGHPRRGGYGMPNRNAAGIDIPGGTAMVLTPSVTQQILGLIAQARAAVPGSPPLPGFPGMPGLPGDDIYATQNPDAAPGNKPRGLSKPRKPRVAIKRLGGSRLPKLSAADDHRDICDRYEAALRRKAVSAPRLKVLCEQARAAAARGQ